MNIAAALPSRLVGFARRHPEILQSLAAFGVKLAGAAVSFLFNFMVARHYGAIGTGSYALALTTTTVTATLALFGLDYILLRTVAGDLKVGALGEARGAVRTIARTVTAIALAGALMLALVGAPLLIALLGQPESTGTIHYAAWAIVPFALLHLAATSLRSTGAVVLAQWFYGPVATIVSLVALLIGTFALGGVSIDALFLVYIGALVAGAVVAWGVYAWRARDWPAAVDVPLRPMLRQSWKISLVVLSMLLADWVILLMLGANFTTAQIGQFRIAWQITSLVGLIVVTFDTVAGPRVAAAHRVGETAGIYRTWRQSVLVMSAMSAPLLLVCILFPSWLLHLFGSDFVAAAPALQILALGQVVNIVSGPVGSILVMTGREGSSLKISAGALVILVGLGLTLIPTMGIVGAAWTTSLTMMFRNSIACVLVLQGLRKR
ncbi:hypothetical protein IP88_01035 [alpha proteobacterium AAP81b]|nr:hypothetical protein IP88_01035 [alpha proteobacterium AAP81b]